MRCLFVCCNQRVYRLFFQTCEDTDITFGIIIAHVQPELVEAIWTRVLAVQPYVAALGLTELTAVRFGNQWACQCERLAATHLLDELGASRDVAPLIATAHLQLAVLMLVEIYVVVALQQLVGELCERHSLAALAVETLLYRVLCHHVVDGNQLAHLACEIKEGVVLHPVVVVYQFCCVLALAKVQETLQLGLDACLVVAQSLLIQ